MIEDKPVFTLKEVAEYFSVHPGTIRRHAKQGFIPAFKIGATWRFNKDSIDRWRKQSEDCWANQTPRQ